MIPSSGQQRKHQIAAADYSSYIIGSITDTREIQVAIPRFMRLQNSMDCMPRGAGFDPHRKCKNASAKPALVKSPVLEKTGNVSCHV